MSHTPRLVTLDEIRRAFTLAWIGASPPIQRSSNGGYYIRVLVQDKYSYFATDPMHKKYDYFRIANTGTIIGAPWGHAKTYRPGYMNTEELEAAIAELNPEGGSAANPARVPDHPDLRELQ